MGLEVKARWETELSDRALESKLGPILPWVSVEDSRLEFGFGDGAPFEVHDAVLGGSQVVLDYFCLLVQRHPVLFILVGNVHIAHRDIGLLLLSVANKNQNAIALKVLVRVFQRRIRLYTLAV